MSQDSRFEDNREKCVTIFLSSVIVTEKGCWQWWGKVDYQGYAVVRGIKAARISWILHKGKIPHGKCVLHRCDHPLCTNPKCLWLGTKGQNNTDRAEKNRNKFPWKTLTRYKVLSIRRKKKRGWSTAKLSRHYKVSATTIYQIVTDNPKHRSYKYL